jgi:ABC-2 type transport system ATP-binding protein
VAMLKNVGKTFLHRQGKRIEAVKGLSLEIRRGEIFSLVGPDGAGKTTTLRMMCGVIPPTEGSIQIMGMDMKAQREAIKHRIGYLSQRFSLYGDLTVEENIDFFAEIHHLRNFGGRKEELLRFTRLTPFRNRLAEQLSGGMKQKLALACTLIHTPDIIFLDEPTTGVDPVSRRDFWKILSAVLKGGVTIVMSTPYLDEAERSTRVALLYEGSLLLCDIPARIKNSFPFEVVEIFCADPRKGVQLLNENRMITRAELFGDRIHALIGKGEIAPSALAKFLMSHDIEVTSTKKIVPSLEDVFIHRTTEITTQRLL